MSKWIILESQWSGDKLEMVNIVLDENSNTLLFDSREEADQNLEANHDVGCSYHIVEIW